MILINCPIFMQGLHKTLKVCAEKCFGNLHRPPNQNQASKWKIRWSICCFLKKNSFTVTSIIDVIQIGKYFLWGPICDKHIHICMYESMRLYMHEKYTWFHTVPNTKRYKFYEFSGNNKPRHKLQCRLNFEAINDFTSSRIYIQIVKNVYASSLFPRKNLIAQDCELKSLTSKMWVGFFHWIWAQSFGWESVGCHHRYLFK